MAKKSAGILLYRFRESKLEVLLVHPGGPLWAKKDLSSWSIPKGEYTTDELPLDAAQREFQEETGHPVSGPFLELAPAKQPSGKVIQAYAVEGDIDPSAIRSNTFSMEWPPRSGTMSEFPEIDKGNWFGIPEARRKLFTGQLVLLDEIIAKLGYAGE
jgi:predicted NUDIX family NTP pyrophosphohydrolase